MINIWSAVRWWGRMADAHPDQRHPADAVEKRGRPQDEIQYILGGVEAGAERSTKPWLRRAFGLIYTRANVVSTPAYLAGHVLLVPSMHAAAIALFATSRKEAYRQLDAADVKMTYVVLCFTAVLDVFGVLISELLYWALSKRGSPRCARRSRGTTSWTPCSG